MIAIRSLDPYVPIADSMDSEVCIPSPRVWEVIWCPRRGHGDLMEALRWKEGEGRAHSPPTLPSDHDIVADIPPNLRDMPTDASEPGVLRHELDGVAELRRPHVRRAAGLLRNEPLRVEAVHDARVLECRP